MNRSHTFFWIAVGLILCGGCADAPAPAVAQRSGPPKPAAPPPGDKGDEPIDLGPTAATGPATPIAPAATTPGTPATPGVVAPNPVVANPAAPAPVVPAPVVPAPVVPNGGVGLPPGGPVNSQLPAATLDPNAVLTPVSTYFAGSNSKLINEIANATTEFRKIHYGFPATQADFDKDVIAAHNIQLPALSPNEHYQYDAKSGQLMVARSAGGAVVTAGPGDGVAGKGYGSADGGIITAPISAGFMAQEQITFDQLAKAMQLFKAEKNRNPSSQAEFDKEIIKQWGITLPALAPGEQYFYDPASGELKRRISK